MVNTITFTPYYIDWTDIDDNEHFLTFADSLTELCYHAAKLYAFDDCGPSIKVNAIVADGVDIAYMGWQPGMVYEFYDCETKEIVYHGEFPEWDH